MKSPHDTCLGLKDEGILVCAREAKLEILNRSTTHEIAFEMAASNVRFGAGVTREVGMDLADLGIRSALRHHRSDPSTHASCPDGARIAGCRGHRLHSL